MFALFWYFYMRREEEIDTHLSDLVNQILGAERQFGRSLRFQRFPALSETLVDGASRRRPVHPRLVLGRGEDARRRVRQPVVERDGLFGQLLGQRLLLLLMMLLLLMLLLLLLQMQMLLRRRQLRGRYGSVAIVLTVGRCRPARVGLLLEANAAPVSADTAIARQRIRPNIYIYINETSVN